jgi:hypothetical protein
MMRLIVSDIRRNDQKFFDEALKNSLVENLTWSAIKLENNPPDKNELIRKPAIIKVNKPFEK